jgi:ribosomal protein L11 methylase PrmA
LEKDQELFGESDCQEKGLKDREEIRGSFRDPSGFVYYSGNSLYRQINLSYKENYDHLMNSGLYKGLVNRELLIPHKEIDVEGLRPDKFYKVIEPERISFISYPYEWCFSQLKNAAMATLNIQKISLEYGMILKDSSAYNIQFKENKPVLIDTLSFEKYIEGKPWIAYGQFCRHFLGPLALMVYKDIRLNQLLRVYLDGIPLDLVSSLLPVRTYLLPSILSNLHLHAKSQKYYADKAVNLGANTGKMSRMAFYGLIDSLESTVKKLKWKERHVDWAGYYEKSSYSTASFEHKKQVVAEYLDMINPGRVWDLGSNRGVFSRVAGAKGLKTISFDIDHAAAEKNYLECIQKEETNIFPLLLDLTNPTPGMGWENNERMSLIDRGPADTVLALALIHHLAISNNLPFSRISKFLNSICKSLIIEFVPKSDDQVQGLLSNREDIFPDYTREAFEREFSKCFNINRSAKIKSSERILYLMGKK